MKHIFEKIYDLGLHSVIVETGPNFLSSVIKENLFNEFYLFKSNNKIQNSVVIDVKNIIYELNKKFKFSEKVSTFLDNNTLMKFF